MSLSITCKCGTKLSVKPEHVGNRVKCPVCRRRIDVVPVAIPATSTKPVVKKSTVTVAQPAKPSLNKAVGKASRKASGGQTLWITFAVISLSGLLVGAASLFFFGPLNRQKNADPSSFVQGKKQGVPSPPIETKPSKPSPPAKKENLPMPVDPEPKKPKVKKEMKEDKNPPLPQPKNEDVPAVLEHSRPKEFTNSVGMKLVLIPAGKFRMGSPADEKWRLEDEEQHDVEITQQFYMGKLEVTQAQYQLVMGNNPSYFSGEKEGLNGITGMDTRDFPVESVTFEQAKAFCQKLTNLSAENKAGRKYFLPTEAQWEYSCRAGTRTAYHYGATISADYVNFEDNEKKTLLKLGALSAQPTKVGSYPPNSFGLHDMHGNVYEWCEDFYDKNYYRISSPKDPKNETPSDWRVMRGGSCVRHERFIRSGNRDRRPSRGSGGHFFDLGFRVVLLITPDLRAEDATDIASLPMPKLPQPKKEITPPAHVVTTILPSLPKGIQPTAAAKAKRLVRAELKWIKLAAHPSGATSGTFAFSDVQAKSKGFVISYLYAFTGPLKEQVKSKIDFSFDTDGYLTDLSASESNALLQPFTASNVALYPLREYLLDRLKKQREKSDSLIIRTGISLTEKGIQEAKSRELVQLYLQAKQVFQSDSRTPTQEEEWDNRLVERTFARGISWHGLTGKTQTQIISFDADGDMAYVVLFKNDFGDKVVHGCSGPYAIKVVRSRIEVTCTVKEISISDGGVEKQYRVGGLAGGDTLVFTIDRFSLSKDKREAKSLVVGFLALSTSEPFQKLLGKLPAGGGRFFVDADFNEGRYQPVEYPVADEFRYKEAIIYVLQQDQRVGTSAKSRAEIAREMGRIELAKCPSDFQAEYKKHITAWEQNDERAISSTFTEVLRLSTKYRVNIGPFE